MRLLLARTPERKHRLAVALGVEDLDQYLRDDRDRDRDDADRVDAGEAARGDDGCDGVPDRDDEELDDRDQVDLSRERVEPDERHAEDPDPEADQPYGS